MVAWINALLNLYAATVMSVLLLGCVRTKQDARKKSIRFIWIVLICIAFLLLNAVAFYGIYQDLSSGQTGSARFSRRIVECVSAICYYVLLSLMVLYVTDLIRENAFIPKWLPATTLPFAFLGALGWCITSFSCEVNEIYRGAFYEKPSYWLGRIGGYYIFALLLFLIIRYRKTLGPGRAASFSVFIALPLGAILLRQLQTRVDYLPLALSLSIIIIRNLVDIERARTVNLQEAWLREERVRIMLSQIRPHFLYNTLNTIYVLCEQDPAMAQKAIEEFSEFLRANLGSLEEAPEVPFEKELELGEHYLYLEKMRYQDELCVKIDCQATNFYLPPLSIQPLLENAVKHGLAKAPGGGTVRMSSREMPEAFVVEVADDGVGFSVEELEKEEGSDGALHVGLRSVEERVRTISGGRLEIESAPGQGTVARVYLPKKKPRRDLAGQTMYGFCCASAQQKIDQHL